MRLKGIIAICLAALSTILPSNGQVYQETENFVSEAANPIICGLPSIREINGGSVFKVQYTGNWSPEMRGAFEYACKIVEEIMPPCLPITVKAEVSEGAAPNTGFSSVRFIGYNDFSCGRDQLISLAPQIKAVVLGEYETRSFYQFFNKIESVSFFEDFSKPDIRITYYRNHLDDCSFSLSEIPGDKYDFVSIAIRDLLKGIGFTSIFKANTANKEIINVANDNTTSFDSYVRASLFGDGTKTPFENATCGALPLYGKRTPSGNIQLNLYAPSNWQDGMSLNYFIPSEDYQISKVLRYDFGKGTVTRDLDDPNNISLFQDLLYWCIFTTTSTGNISSSGNGSTENFVKYNGQISVDFGKNSLPLHSNAEMPDNPQKVAEWTNPTTIEHITSYCKPFHVFYHGMENELDKDGWTVSVLKKDGRWDCVCFSGWPDEQITFKFSDLTFHYNPEDYARTCEGYLRCRITRSYNQYGGSGNPRRYDVRYFVMDYLPQAVELGISSTGREQNPGISAMATTTPVRIGMKNLEGLTRLVLEVKPQGARVPNKIEVSDLKSGVVELQLTSGKVTTITPVSYNANGSVTGEPLTVDLSK